MASGTVRVVKRKGHPRYSWVVIWYEGGKRRHSYHRKENGREGAKEAAAAKVRELRHVAPSDAPVSLDERKALLRARDLEVPLLVAVEAYAKSMLAQSKSVTVKSLAQRRLAAAGQEKLATTYEGYLRRTLADIAAFYGDRNAAGLTTEDAAAWIYAGKGAAAATIRKRRAILSGMFEFGRRLGVLEVNPAQNVKPPRAEISEAVCVLSPAEARDYLLAVATVAPSALALESICLFAGLRRSEAERLDWGDVKLDRGFIEVSAGISKTRNRRLVDIEPALEQILSQVPVPKVKTDRKTGLPKPRLLRPVNARKLRDKALKAAGWLGDKWGNAVAQVGARPWPDNALRHSFVSYHLTLYGDVALTELQAGHDRKVLFKHYRELVTRGAAEEFWSATLVLPGQ